VIEKVKTNIVNFLAKEDSTYHILSYIISSMLISTFPIIWFIVFMKEKMIFSYDFFTNGMFGLSIFFLISIFLLLIFGFLLVGFTTLFTIYLYKRKHNKFHDSLGLGMILLLLNVAVNYIIFTNLNTEIEYNTFLFIVIFNIIFYIHIGISLVGKGMDKIISLVIFIITFTWSSIAYQKEISSFIETGLIQFRMGGGIETEIINFTKNKSISKGKLILLTPNEIYLEVHNDIKIFNRNNIIIKFLDSNKT